jgi:Flp pilus assembly protein TadG
MRTKPPPPARRPPVLARSEGGATVVEFALAVSLFFLFVFGLLEFARAVYLWNTAQEITRRAARAAAMADCGDPAALAAIRQNAVFRSTPGTLALGGDVGDGHVQIDYLSLDAAGNLQAIAPAALPAGRSANARNCTANPEAANCIRFVRASLCAPGSATDACDGIAYTPMIGLLAPLFAAAGPLPLTLPPSTTVVKAESLGYTPGAGP